MNIFIHGLKILNGLWVFMFGEKFMISAVSKLFVFQIDCSAAERVMYLYEDEFFLLSQKEVGQGKNFEYRKVMILVIGSFACICLCISVGSSYISSNDMPLGPIIEHRRPIGRAIPDLFIYKSKSNGMFFASITSSPKTTVSTSSS